VLCGNVASGYKAALSVALSSRLSVCPIGAGAYYAGTKFPSSFLTLERKGVSISDQLFHEVKTIYILFWYIILPNIAQFILLMKLSLWHSFINGHRPC